MTTTLSEVTAARTTPHALTGAEAEALGLRLMSGRPPIRTYLRDLWDRREFILLIPKGELRSRSANTLLGSAWHLLNPLMLAFVYFFIFSIILGGARANIHPNYLGFIVVGIFVYMMTRKTVLAGARTVVKDTKLLQNINFPAAVLPISAGLSELLAQGYAYLAMFGIVLLTGEEPHLVWVLVIPLAVMQLLMNWGFAFVTARLTVHFRDVQEVLPYLLRIGLYVSGVLFPASKINDPVARTIFELNPLYAYVASVRGIVLDGVVDGKLVATAAAWSVALLVFGFVFFWRYEGQYANA